MQSDKQTLPIPAASDLNSLTVTITNPSYQQLGKGLSFITATVFIIGEVAGGGILTLPKAVAGAGISYIIIFENKFNSYIYTYIIQLYLA